MNTAVTEMAVNDAPLVSIGLPCYNRAHMIGRAIESALNQDYPNLELVISDNASTDETEAICREYAARDQRITYLRQGQNQGPTANFQSVLDHAQGEFFVWLGDDDWFDSNYLSACVRVLQENSDCELVYGQACYYDGSELVREAPGFALEQQTPFERVRGYYNQVDDNAMFYGVMRRRTLVKLPAFRNVMGGDWLLMAQVVCIGKIMMQQQARVHRSLGGTSQSTQKIASVSGLPFLQSRYPFAFIALSSTQAMLRHQPFRRHIAPGQRLRLALLCQPELWARHLRHNWRPTILSWRTHRWMHPAYRFLKIIHRVLRSVRHWRR